MFYNINKNELVSLEIYYKDVEFADENGDTHQGVDTYFLDNCDDETLRSLGFARVVEQEAPANGDIYKEPFILKSYDEAKNIYNISYEIRDVSTESAKEIKLDELSSIKATKLLTLNYDGNEYQIDSDSKINISGKVSQILLATSSGQDTGAINWITKDNKVVSFSKEEFMAFGVAVAAHTESVLFKHDQLRTAVNNATSIDEIKAIEWVD
ncbi:MULTISPECIES: DUF4376 domain-containing protein [Campylobacter]|uniref:DUF4376 domain-containing protein n=1 Tax=Campylobacter vicugnae TaxID=1660076 RepID=A0ABZ2E773_9BACT|nr:MULTISPECIES: DUF4376 domain-containing protein [unclassified Campylobacter]MCR8690610.1 DUF4376 domain-containing protein [Campylobacter sp. RM9264]MCR8701481.1 DUF4376 domain-containing protein [Campylobacter sp. RM12176]